MEASGDLISLLHQNLRQVTSLREQLADLPSYVQSQATADLGQLLQHFASELQGCSEPEKLLPEIVGGLLGTTLKLLGQLEEGVKSSLRSEKSRENLIINTAKLNAMVSSWDRAAYETPADDLMALPRDHERWRHLHDISEIHRPSDPLSLRVCIEDMYKTVIWAHAFISKAMEYTNATMRKLMTGYYVFYYSVNSTKAYRQARLNFANPSLESIVQLARTEDSVAVRMLESSPFKVACNRMIFICRESNRVAYKPESATIPVRVVSSQPITFSKSVPAPLFPQTKALADHQRPAKAVVHVHGGGFMAMSSGGHLPYLQKWALDNPGLVIFSVDYRLAPEHPYPAGPDDVWQVYEWLVNHAREEMDIDVTKVILAGDSAGGHIATGCVIRAILNNKRVPDGLLLPYPALCMDPDHYTPSLNLSLDDMVLNYTFLKSCLAAYLQDSSLDPKGDPMLSPIYAQRSILSRFPPTRILVGTLDPLMDDCLRFAEKLLDARVDIRLAVFENVIHGGMNHMIKMENEDIKALTLRSSSYLSELLEKA